MAPTIDQLGQQLKATVADLEQRLDDARANLAKHGSGSSAATSEDGMRMILMGPPGAGTCRITLDERQDT